MPSPPPGALPAANGGGGSALAAALSKKPSGYVSSRFYSASCRICRCSIQNTAPPRAWVVFKEGRGGSWPKWVHTGSEGSFAASAVEGSKNLEKGLSEKDVLVLDEKAARVQRRQKEPASVAGNLDLLTIPGVGPRNLRKLVDKGIAGVSELKQLYRDKVLK